MDLRKIKEKARTQGVSVPLVLKEQLHFLVLEYLFRQGAFSDLVFQGGTALRIVYKGVRYSEDLDFVLRRRNSSFFAGFSRALEGLPSYVDKFIPFGQSIRLKVQKKTPTFQRLALTMRVDALNLTERVQIEIAHVPSYENETVIVQSEDLPLTPAIRVETAREILSDKFCAFGSREYVKGRDIWDIHFLLHTLKVIFDREVKKTIHRKISDYGLKEKEFFKGFIRNLSILEKEGISILKTEMDRFLPSSYRNLFSEKYPELCQGVLGALAQFSSEVKRK